MQLELVAARQEAERVRRICDAKEKALEALRGEVEALRSRADMQTDEIRGLRVAMLTRSMQSNRWEGSGGGEASKGGGRRGRAGAGAGAGAGDCGSPRRGGEALEARG